MSKKKIQRFAETTTFHNFFQPSFDEAKDHFANKGKWNKNYFKNDNDIILELGCGKGEYTTGLGKKYPDRNFIGVDIKGARMWRGAKTAIEEQLLNIAFLRTHISNIDLFFGQNEVSEIWITFPDPQPKKEKKRLTSARYLETYKKILKPEAIIHLKTDNAPLYEYTLETIEYHKHKLLFDTNNLYKDHPTEEVAEIQTFYEKMWLEQGLKIHYIKFMLS